MRGYLVVDENIKQKFFETCFDAYWKNNIDISNKEKVDEILDICKIDKNIFFEKINNLEIKEKLKKLTSSAFEKDVFGAPTFIVNDKIFWGQDRLDYAIDEYFS